MRGPYVKRAYRMSATDHQKNELTRRYLRAVKQKHKLDQGCWILLKKRLPILNPPPPLSIHFSHPWMMSNETVERYVKLEREEANNIFGGIESNPITARKILWNGEDLRVFDYEYSVISAESMMLYVTGAEGMAENTRPSHVFRSGATLAEKKVETEIVEGERRPIYEAALVDGCTPEQAYLVALEKDPLEATEFPPPVGWYECQPEYLDFFF